MKRKSKKTKKRTKSKVKPLRSSKMQIEKALKSARYFTKYALQSSERKILRNIIHQVKKGYDSKKLYSKRGKYVPTRLKLHNKIIKSYLRKDKTTRTPDVYVFGGPGGSGKTTVLKKYVKENTITINNDDIKKILSKYNPSPIKRLPLIHAAFLHEEASDIEKEIVEKTMNSNKDIILDRTLASYMKNKKLLQQMKKKGYKVTVLGTNLPPHIALIRVASRFIKKGRYVPLKIIAQKGNKMNSNVIRMGKNKFVSKTRILDTRRSKPKMMYKRG